MAKKKYYMEKEELEYFLEDFVPTEQCMNELNRVLLEGNKYDEGGFKRYGYDVPLSEMNFELALMSDDPVIKANQRKETREIQRYIGLTNDREIGHALQWTKHRGFLHCKKK